MEMAPAAAEEPAGAAAAAAEQARPSAAPSPSPAPVPAPAPAAQLPALPDALPLPAAAQQAQQAQQPPSAEKQALSLLPKLSERPGVKHLPGAPPAAAVMAAFGVAPLSTVGPNAHKAEGAPQGEPGSAAAAAPGSAPGSAAAAAAGASAGGSGRGTPSGATPPGLAAMGAAGLGTPGSLPIPVKLPKPQPLVGEGGVGGKLVVRVGGLGGLGLGVPSLVAVEPGIQCAALLHVLIRLSPSCDHIPAGQRAAWQVGG